MVIHLIAPKNQQLWHPIWKKCYNIWKTSPYEVKLWSDEDVNTLLEEEDKDFYLLLNQLPPIYKLDYVRYVILEKFGGAYFDMDVELYIDFIPNINPNKIYLMGSDNPKETVQNSIMISLLPNSIFWKDLKNHIKFKIKNNFNKCLDLNSILPIGTIVRKMVGPIILSKHIELNRSSISIEILAHQHFNRGNNEIRFTYHHQTGVWGQTLN